MAALGSAVVISSGPYLIYRATARIGRARPNLSSLSTDDTGQ